MRAKVQGIRQKQSNDKSKDVQWDNNKMCHLSVKVTRGTAASVFLTERTVSYLSCLCPLEFKLWLTAEFEVASGEAVEAFYEE